MKLVSLVLLVICMFGSVHVLLDFVLSIQGLLKVYKVEVLNSVPSWHFHLEIITQILQCLLV